MSPSSWSLLSPSHSKPHTYHAHRRQSFIATDIPEQVEIRARLRTFEGSYSRTALACLGYSVLVLKLFDIRFYRIGLLYVILSLLLLLVQFQRRRNARHDFADQYSRARLTDPGPQGKDRIWGREFRTAGWSVLLVTLIVGIVEVALFGLVCAL
ncbi:hypothetical protein DACRYDRAFT_85218 [Dacryopinax primogenitus]|uniref:DUF202 domain-containing protein n=1 Tax=Dacryopinax primogenitus (strain DJM 731) TaxID=1858805 RepID=M5FNC5_DACPD|nr:uncharacterized protein DACRYDRAFT_85218 [Dacryopinax primogenitus]EJT97205.1 hypothetical protein DACRYDRAFT_85218 [Dacryopinax primogenitus]